MKLMQEMEAKMANSEFWDDINQAQRDSQNLTQLKSAVLPWNDLDQQIQSHLSLLEMAIAENDTSFESDITNDLVILNRKYLELELMSMLSDPIDSNNCYLYIHPGAGGTESCDWANMLLRMYMRWAEAKEFEREIIDMQPGEEAGIRSVTVLIKGQNAFGFLKGETGVHRLVRISPFDSNKRRHTSFASVFVYPEIDDSIDVDINEVDLKVDTYRSSGAGGQHVNVTNSAIRITHIPSGIVVTCQNERSQHKNRATAMKILRARLYEKARQEKQMEIDKINSEKKDISWGNQIRSYVFQPYCLIKDHRTNMEIGNVQAVMDGDIDSFIEAYLKGQLKHK